MIEVNVLVSEPEICITTFFYIFERHDPDIRGPLCINSTLPNLILSSMYLFKRTKILL